MGGLIEHLERLGYASWPAAEVERLGDWYLRFSSGYSGRANAVLTLGAPGCSFEEAISRIALAYHRRRIAARVQLSPASPPGLDEALAAAGWSLRDCTHVMTAKCDRILQDVPHIDLVNDEPTTLWRDIFLAESNSPADGLERLGVIARVPRPCTFAIAREALGTPASIGLMIPQGKFAGIFGMRTQPQARRQGLGRAILQSLAMAARDHGADNLYLQVTKTNLAAVSLYTKAGFERIYDYHYRMLSS